MIVSAIGSSRARSQGRRADPGEVVDNRAAVDERRPPPVPVPMLCAMTTPLDHTDREQQALHLYADEPLDDGDAVLLLDGTVCLELERMADEWDDVGRRSLVSILTTTSQRVLVAIARDGGRLLPRDYQLWRDLHADLRGTDVELLPVRALPAA